MDDTLKSLTLGLFALLIVQGGLRERVRQNAVRQVRDSFDSVGRVRVGVEPRGFFGLLAADAWSVDIYGEKLRAGRLPFRVTPRAGKKGRIRHLRLHLRDLTLAGLPIAQLDADIPFTTFDLGHAAWRSRLYLRSAGTGPAFIRMTMEGLRAFAARKYQGTLSDVRFWTQNRKLYLSATARLFGFPAQLLAAGQITAREGRYLDLTQPLVFLDGLMLSREAAEALVQQFNPVLDTERDLNLEGFITLQSVEIGQGSLLIHGQATIPKADADNPQR